MKPLLSTTAMGLLLCLGYSLPASAEQSKDCGVTMPCAKMGTDLKYTSGVQSKDCGVTMPCAKAAAAGTATAAAKRTRVSNGPSAAIRTSAAATPPPSRAPATTVRTGYAYQSQPSAWGSPATGRPMITGRSASVRTAPQPAFQTSGGWSQPQPWGWGNYQPWQASPGYR
jgi:hypothetical protein